MPEPDPLPSIKTPWDSATPPSGVAPGDGPPIPIPDHTLIRRVGKGSYGEVWLARNILGVYRAVKIIHRGSFDDDRPFEREFAGMQRFEPVSRSHESQLNILQVGRGPDCFYYVMELADDMGDALPDRSAGFSTGETGPTGKSAFQPDTYTPRSLRSELLLRGRLPVDECIRLGLALTTALENLHRHGLVHRDIKPSNIVFVNGIPKLADIGLVARAEATMSFVGTEGYLPPEGPGTVQADLFSLGKVLYELSTGRDRQQFPELPTGVTELPDRAALAEFNEVLLRACAPDVKQRYESAAEMHADLALLQSGRSVARMRAVERRLKFVVRAGTVVTGIALVAGAAFFYQQVQTREARRLAAENKGLAEAKTRLADEKTQLADDKSKLAEENRERLVRLDIANGVRLMDANDFSGALLWFAEALPLLANNPSEEAIHRIRIQQVLSQSPRLLHVFPHDANVQSGAFSPDGRRVATGTRKGDLRIWDLESGAAVVGPLHLDDRIGDMRFSKAGTRLLVRGTRLLVHFAVVISAATGRPVFEGVSNAVRTAFSPDDRLLAVARTNFVIEVLDAMNGRGVVELSGHTNEITMLSFSPDGSLLASASLDQTVRLWRLPSGEPVGSPLRHAQAVDSAVFSPDTRRLATATEAPDREKWCFIHTWDVASGTEIGSAIQAESPVYCLAFDPANSRRLITGARDTGIDVRDADSHTAILPHLKFEHSVARCWAFSPDGLRLAAGSDDGTARVWDLETGQPLTPSLQHVGWVESVRFSPDGRRLLTTGDDATAKLWDLGVLPETAKPLQLDEPIDYSSMPPTFPYALSRDGRCLLLCTTDWTLHLVNLDTLKQEGAPMSTTKDLGPLGMMTFDASGRQWAAALGEYTGDHPRNVGLWRKEGGEVRYLELQQPEAARFVQFSSDGSRLVTWSDDAKVRTWQTADGKLLKDQKVPDIYRWFLALSKDGTRAVLSGTGGVLPELLDLSKPGATGVPLTAPGRTHKAAFSPEGDRLASVGSDQHGHIWDAGTGQALTPPFKHNGNLTWVEWAPDGRRVLTAGNSPNVKVWEVGTGEPATAPMELGVKGVFVAHFSPDGRFVVARSKDQLVRVWDSATAEAVTPVFHHAGGVQAVMIARDNRLVTVSAPAVIRAWDLTPTQLPVVVIADYARLLAGRTLDRAGVLRALKPTELAELNQAMMASQPALFTADGKQVREWHHRQIPELTTMVRLKAATFHLDRLAELDPLDPDLKEQRAKVQARRIPPRDPATPANLVDLSDVYTHSFGIHRSFDDLPLGVQTLAGTRFDLRGLVALEAADSEGLVASGSFRLPEARKIRVGRRCRALHFLQAVDGWGGKDGDEVARWLIHYADGSVREWPMVYGEDLRVSWHMPKEINEPKEASQAVIAWEGHPPRLIDARLESVRLFKATWTNSLPDVEVTSLDFVLGKTSVSPFVVAITAE